jgi:HAD superfamily hydrolase (TIGR01509 family)
MTKGVIFDVDGTLVDTVYLHCVSWWQALRQYGHDVETTRIHRAIGMGSDRILDHLLGSDKDRDRSADDDIRTAHSTLFGVYWDSLRPTPGARDLLQAVRDRDRRVVLASSAAAPELAALRRALDADDVVDTVTGADDAEASKPAPDILQVALKRSKLRPEDVVFVGDTVWDVRAAGALDVPCFGLTCGGISEAELLEAGAAGVYANPRALIDAIDVLLKRP